jgi:hypothetical protein
MGTEQGMMALSLHFGRTGNRSVNEKGLIPLENRADSATNCPSFASDRKTAIFFWICFAGVRGFGLSPPTKPTGESNSARNETDRVSIHDFREFKAIQEPIEMVLRRITSELPGVEHRQ